MVGYVGSIEKQTLDNNYFRQVLFTGKYSQLVVMSLELNQEIGNEVHPSVDQFFRIEQGEAAFIFDGTVRHLVKDGDAGYSSSRYISQRNKYFEDQQTEAIYYIFSSQPSRWDHT